MANPTAAAVSAIRSHVSDWTPSDSAIVAALNAPTVANPTPQARLPKPFSSNDLLGQLDPATMQALFMSPSLPRILDDIAAQNTGHCDTWIAAMAKAGVISPTLASSLLGVVNATIPDPSWPALVSWAQINLGRPADSDDVAKARAAS